MDLHFDREESERVFMHLVGETQRLLCAGIVHGDLSDFNVLMGADGPVVIDFPQAVDIAANPQGLNYLHRDVLNVCTWFRRKGVDCDGDALFADLLARAF